MNGFLGFIVALVSVIVAGAAWIPLFEQFVDGVDENLRVCWFLTLFLVLIMQYGLGHDGRVGLGRSMALAAGIALMGLPFAFLFGGIKIGAAALVVATGGGWLAYSRLKGYKPAPDMEALHTISAESKHLKGLPEYYEQHLKSWMEAQEERREKAVKLAWISMCVVMPGSVIVTAASDYFLIPDGADGWNWLVAGVYIVSMGVPMGFAIEPYNKLSDDMKEVLIEKLLGFFGDVHYRKVLETFNADPYTKVGLIGDFNRQSIEDGFLGKYEHTHFVMTEARLKKVTGHGKNRNTSHVFRGLMIALTFPQPFRGRTLVLSDHGKLGNWMKDKSTRLERVNLVHKKFEDVFEVYSTDQVEARAILTPDLMENVVTLARLVRGKKLDTVKEDDEMAATSYATVQFAFDRNLLYITIATHQNLFEVGELDVDMRDTARIAKFAREVGLIYEIIDVMELNRKAEKANAI